MKHSGRIALAIAAILAFLTLSLPALHHHDSDFGSGRIDCQACAWSHSGGAGLLAALPLAFAVLVVPFAAPPLCVPATRDADPISFIRGPPSFSL